MGETRKLYSVKKVLEMNGGPLPMSMPGVYRAMTEGKIPYVAVGKRRFIPGWWIENLLADPTTKGVE